MKIKMKSETKKIIKLYINSLFVEASFFFIGSAILHILFFFWPSKVSEWLGLISIFLMGELAYKALINKSKKD